MKTYLWIEDRKDKSGYIFWQTLLGQLCSEIVLESKKNNSELVKAVKALEDSENRYIIVFDNSFDNLQVAMEQKLLRKYASDKENVVLMDIICFEYILLEFKDLIEWIYAPDDEFLVKRKKAITAREKLVKTIQSGEVNYKDIREIIEYNENVDNYNVEQLSARILFDLTRNTGFEIAKRSVGECWIKSCCEWEERMPDDVCGLDVSRLPLKEKMKQICEGTSLLKQFQNIGLEVAL
ncbi:hypothetical protein LJC58_10385 [Lachnospiraceae bacterium OttesenSCG-928-D06]|nr:hypothetical protein [Lachnospiraceae bacterium OttesenSCG-928-D06]